MTFHAGVPWLDLSRRGATTPIFENGEQRTDVAFCQHSSPSSRPEQGTAAIPVIPTTARHERREGIFRVRLREEDPSTSFAVPALSFRMGSLWSG